MRSVCVLAGSAHGTHPVYRSATAKLATTLAGNGVHIVYGGGNVGAMATLHDAALSAGGTLTGVIPRSLVDREVAATDLDDLRIVETMHERKALMAELADAVIAAPGGLGTLEGFTEVTSWTRLGLHHKPTGLLNTHGYYTPLLSFLDHAVTEGFLDTSHHHNILAEPDPTDLLKALHTRHPTNTGHWWETASVPSR